MTTHTRNSTKRPEQYVVRLSGPQGIVAAIPQYLGFVPERSLILVCMNNPRGRMGPVVRVDLPPPGQSESLTTMLGWAERYADTVAIVCYHDGFRPTCIDELTDAVRARRIPIIATLSVADNRIRDARSKSAWRRDPGIPFLDPDDPQAVALTSASILAGRTPLPSRAALAASITPADGRVPSEAIEAIHAAQGELAAQFQEAGHRLTLDLVTVVDEALLAAEAEYDGSGTLTLPTTGRLIALSAHVPCRDLLIARAIARTSVSTVGVFSALSSRCPDELCADLCVVLAGAAYRSGDGALAHCALDRAQGARPNHRMSWLMRSAIDAALPPAHFDVLADIPIPEATGSSPAGV